MVTISAQQVMESGLERISSIAERYGVNSPETLAACERWGAILDDVNHPDGSCKHCGEAVTFDSPKQMYIHRESGNEHCRTVAAAVAEVIVPALKEGMKL